jgi:hypothetical protein
MTKLEKELARKDGKRRLPKLSEECARALDTQPPLLTATIFEKRHLRLKDAYASLTDCDTEPMADSGAQIALIVPRQSRTRGASDEQWRRPQML